MLVNATYIRVSLVRLMLVFSHMDWVQVMWWVDWRVGLLSFGLFQGRALVPQGTRVRELVWSPLGDSGQLIQALLDALIPFQALGAWC